MRRQALGTPALGRWREEMAAGLRGDSHRDALARAASEEATALEAEADGCHHTATRCLENARALWLAGGDDPLDIIGATRVDAGIPASTRNAAPSWGAARPRAGW